MATTACPTSMRFTLREAFDSLHRGSMWGRGDEAFTGLTTDSRHVSPGHLYLPIRGERFDGHAFIDQAWQAGAGGVVMDHQYAVTHTDARSPLLEVADTRVALAELAAGWRDRFELPVVAVTGSNGKTTVKQMLAAIMAQAVGEHACLATAGNLNNDIGVPLTLLRLRSQHRLAVVELGMNHPGEIAPLAAITRPSVALVNNAQREHQEFLDGVRATAVENGSAFSALPADGVTVFPGDDACTDIWRELAGSRRQLTFGLVKAGWSFETFDVCAAHDARAPGFELHLGGQQVRIELQIDGLHNVRNALAAAACAHAVGIGLETIAAGLARFVPVSGRLQRKPAPAGVTLIDDTYNANPDSVLAAIDVLASFATPRLLVLGDMAEVGDSAAAFHREVGDYARDSGIERLLTVGPLSAQAAQAFGESAIHFEEVASLCAALTADLVSPQTVLVKGSRSMRMERVVQALNPSSVPLSDSEVRDAA